MSIILTKHKMPEQDPKVRAKNFDRAARVMIKKQR